MLPSVSFGASLPCLLCWHFLMRRDRKHADDCSGSLTDALLNLSLGSRTMRPNEAPSASICVCRSFPLRSGCLFSLLMPSSHPRSHAGSCCGVPDVHARTEEAKGAARGSPAPCPPLLLPIGGLGWALAGRQPMTRDVFVSSAVQFEKDYRSLGKKKPLNLFLKRKKIKHTFYMSNF